ncbi:M50 family metallopeptidase [Virgibacillus sp. W0181]|uniref:M50 family metallopeptidase n=1 Tax=Virgibacillus sp. W0181 TaxID=3391581 RepID=UPI003F465866
MTIHNSIFPRIHLHPILYIFILISFVTGTFVELFIILFIVFFHELGHYTMARIFKWRIRNITLWVFGGVMNVEEHANKPLNEEFFVTIAGPMQHLIIFIFLIPLSYSQILPEQVIQLVYYYNSIILLFNLLPIWPLDGGKLLFFSLSSFHPFRKAYYFIIGFSMVITLTLIIYQLFIFSFTLSSFFIMIFLLMENRTEWKHRYYVFIRFLLHRYEGKGAIKGVVPLSVKNNASLMDVFSLFRRDKKHPIYVHFSEHNRAVIDESECLHLYFNDGKYNRTIGELVNKSD